MSTPANIAILLNGVYRSIYLHNSGTPRWAGATLLRSYNDAQKANDLINLGDLSSLYNKLRPSTCRHSFDHPEADVTIAYHRDRNEPLSINETPDTGNLEKDLSNIFLNGDYLYLFKDGEWYFADAYANSLTRLRDCKEATDHV